MFYTVCATHEVTNTFCFVVKYQKSTSPTRCKVERLSPQVYHGAVLHRIHTRYNRIQIYGNCLDPMKCPFLSTKKVKCVKLCSIVCIFILTWTGASRDLALPAIELVESNAA